MDMNILSLLGIAGLMPVLIGSLVGALKLTLHPTPEQMEEGE